MRAFLRGLFGPSGKAPAPASGYAIDAVSEVNRLREVYAQLDDDVLKERRRRASSLPEAVAITAVVASRVLGVQMFESQIQGALALASGMIVEMPTGEGKTLAAVPAIAWLARTGAGVHVLTANDYLARRDAAWMGPLFDWHGLSVAAIQQRMTTANRRQAYRADITYATANEVGFDLLRDGLALDPAEQVHRPFAAAVIDEADSILIDEARTPLVIAGGEAVLDDWPFRADAAVRSLRAGDFTVAPDTRNVVLTASGIAHVERAFGVGNLYDEGLIDALTAVQEALHAHALLHRDVDYVVHDHRVLSVDEFKGRIVHDRRWPAGLQTALECKEYVRPQKQGCVLGSITIEHLAGLYPFVSGMTGTAATQADEFRRIYGLDVVVIPPHKPVVRDDRDDLVFSTKMEKERAVVAAIGRAHTGGQPVLVGTESIDASERLSRALGDLPHHVLNARNEEAEAAVIARAGERGAVTISTNMAGRGVDIQLGAGVAGLGGLLVIGTNRHESRRIDHQLRGRAGRQGDPGASQFFISQEDPLFARLDPADRAIGADQAQRIAEGQNLDIRLFLRKYESVIEGQRQMIAVRRQEALEHPESFATRAEQRALLETLDELWSDYLAAVAEVRSGTAWISLGYADPLRQYISQIHRMFIEMEGSVEDEAAERLTRNASSDPGPRQRSATWTYITTDQPFGPAGERVMRGLVQMVRRLRS